MNKRSLMMRRVLSASLSLVFVVGAGQALAADPPTQAARTESQAPVTDSWITTKVKADMMASSNVPGTKVEVTTVNGVVTLKGNVATKAEHDKAITTAKGIKGVKSVDASALKVSAAASR